MADDLRAAAAAWAAEDPDPRTRAEVEALLAAGDDDGLAARFATRLQFGTAGLRGVLGAGPNRMNRALVRRTAAGFARYLRGRGLGPGGVVIGCDARHQSEEFAADTAAVLAGAGITALVLPRPLPTPLLAYATRFFHADAGIMVTASHNPAQYNGYKVYLGDGAQIIAPADKEISAEIATIASLAEVPLAAPDDPRICRLDDAVVDRYLADARAQSLEPAARQVRVVYTPMHGVGGPVATRLLREAGFADVHVVGPQAQPDPDFPTVAFPNPEEPGALDLAVWTAARLDADLVLANDPDADRLGAAVPIPGGGWRSLTGDEIGVLLADHVLRHSQGDDRLVVTSIVSSTLLSKMAAAAGVHFVETLTGFKWLVRAADAHPEWRFVYAYEEALGYCVGTTVRDKDGITAAMLLAEVGAGLIAEGRTVWDRLDDLARTFGVHATRQWSTVLAGDDGPARIRAVMRQLRAHPPERLGPARVTGVVDLLHRPGGLAPTDGVVLRLGEGVRVIVRPSGTEPKMKTYFEVVQAVDGDVGAARAHAQAVLDQLEQAVVALSGLPAPGGGD